MFLASPSEDDCFTAIGAFLDSILPAGTEVVVGQVNRVPQPKGTDHIVMWPIMRNRIATNIRSEGDVKYVGSITGTTMTVSDAQSGQIAVGNYVFGVNVLDGTKVDQILTGTGGVGTYQLNKSQNI